jgi:hypothetical protein
VKWPLTRIKDGENGAKMYFRKAADLHTISDRNIYDFPCFI